MTHIIVNLLKILLFLYSFIILTNILYNEPSNFIE